jgi:phenylalanyl-tRNA synthetase beta chain
VPAEDTAGPTIEVEIRDPDLCWRYVARCIDRIQVGQSPAWMQRRLRAVGQRPISNVVDAANYALLELGQPLHTFDRDRLSGGIVVRRGLKGEQLDCLDGRTRDVGPDSLVIADAQRAQALAGIIGGAASAVSDATSRVVIESATFLGVNVRATSRRLGLRTEASLRFEKQLHPELAPLGAARLAELLQQVAAGGPSGPAVDAHPAPHHPAPIQVRSGFFSDLLGAPVEAAEVNEILRRLSFSVEIDGDQLVVVAPPFRLDVGIPEDLVEEVGRLRGYDGLPSTLPGRRLPVTRILPPPDPQWHARELALAAGFDEVIALSFAGPADPAEIGVFPRARVRLANPMSPEQEGMRTSLIPGMTRILARNAAVGRVEGMIFELGKVFWPRAGQDLPDEPRILGLAQTLQPERGETGARTAILHAKGFLQRLSGALTGVELDELQDAVPGLHPGRGLRLSFGGAEIGCLGQLHPEITAALGAPGAVVVGEINLEPLLAALRIPSVLPIPRHPAVIRDLAITVDRTIPARDVIEVIRGAGEGILRSVELFDEYTGRQVEPGRKGLAFHLTFQAEDRTLTGAEVTAAEERIIKQLADRLDARLRG